MTSVMALISGNYKLIKSEENGLELFDLSNDLSEENDLQRSLPRKVAELLSQMENYLRAVDAETAGLKGKGKKRKKE
ncbi:MAG: hypothetical protein ACI9NT_001849 [Bacteroidia bacterium]|jgi:hypothetical protein